MGAGLAGKLHIPENTGEAPEILILQPGGGGETEYLHGDQVGAVFEGGGNVKMRGGKAVLAVANELAVYPKIEGRFYPVEGEHHAIIPPAFGDVHPAGIAADRVEFLGHLGRADSLMAIPGVLGVHILREAVSLQLDMPGYLNGIPAGAVIMGLLKAHRPLRRMLHIMELPAAVQ